MLEIQGESGKFYNMIPEKLTQGSFGIIYLCKEKDMPDAEFSIVKVLCFEMSE